MPAPGPAGLFLQRRDGATTTLTLGDDPAPRSARPSRVQVLLRLPWAAESSISKVAAQNPL